MNDRQLLDFPPALPQPQVSNGDELEDNESSTTTARFSRLSALHLFRRDYIAGFQSTNTEKRNWFSADAWREVREVFASLPRERQQCYERERDHILERERCLPKPQKKNESTSVLLLATRRPASSQAQTEVQVPSQHLGCDEPLVSGINASAPVLGNLMPGDREKLQRATQDLDSLSRVSRGCARECIESGDTTVWPVDESQILASLVSLRAKGKTLSNAASEFSDRCQTVAGPDPSQPAFPKTVEIHGQCGTLCQLEYSTADRLQHGQIVSALQQACSFDKPTKAVQADVLIAACVEGGGSKTLTYFFMTAISGKGGYIKPDSVQILCKVLSRRSGDDFETGIMFGLLFSLFARFPA